MMSRCWVQAISQRPHWIQSAALALRSVDDVEVLGTGHLAASALDTVGCIGFTVGEQEPFLLKIKLLNHFFLGFIHQQFFIVILHKIGNRNIDRATPHAVAATGTEFVHFIGYMTADPLDIGICKRGGLIGDRST
jgi:hypothetical protein